MSGGQVLYREEGITFIDPSFAPGPRALYADPDFGADAWKCSGCQSRNARRAARTTETRLVWSFYL